MEILSYIADGLWIVALAIMASASRAAWRRTRPGVGVPLQFDRQGRPTLRAPRGVALWLIPGLALAVSLLLLWAHRTLATDAQGAVILFGARATLAAVFALAHLTLLRLAMAALASEGALKS